MGSQPFAAARRGVRHLLGRHSPRVQVGGAVSGVWLWRVDCTCALLHRGAEPTLTQAREAAFAVLGERDDVPEPRDVFGPQAAQAWPEAPMLRQQARQLVLPDLLRGDGSLVAADASRRDSDEHAGWGFVTDVGWHRRGTVAYAGADVSGLELLAIAHALQVYPDGHLVDVLSDNLDARNMARRILSGRTSRRVEVPRWVPDEAFLLLRDAFHRRLAVRVVEVKSKTHPLHNVADRLARGLSPAVLVHPKEDT